MVQPAVPRELNALGRKLTTTTPIIVRALETTEEIQASCRLMSREFGGREGTEESATRRRLITTESPEYRPGQARGAFHDGQLVGGYIMHERRLRVGAALLPTACIDAVVTDPEHRMGGIGRALMEDAIAHAIQKGHALLMLDGIPNFYHRFGYIDVWDATDHLLSRAAIVTQPPSSYTVRPATPEDAIAVRDLYLRHYGSYTGSFERSLEVQRYRLGTTQGAVLVIDVAGRARGFLLGRRGEPWRAEEVAVDNWQAALALLHWQETLTAAEEPGQPAIVWPIPPDATLLTWLTDRLAPPHLTDRQHAARRWAVRSESYHHPDAGWMARPASLSALFDSLLPAWRERWATSEKPWRGILRIEVEGTRVSLELGEDVRFGGQSDGTVCLTPASLVQLLFGFRDVRYVADRHGNVIPKSLFPALEVLFPTGHAWIPGTDAF